MIIAPYNELMIVGYNDKLDEHMVPTRVGPIYRWNPTDGSETVYLAAPFESHMDEGVVGGVRMTEEEIEASDDLTLFDEGDPFQPKPGNTLWIDENFAPHYEAAGVVKDKMLECAQALTEKSREEIQNDGDKALAMRYAAQARAASGQYLGGYVVAAALYKMANDLGKVALMRKMALRICSGGEFDEAVNRLATPTQAPKSVMSDVATRKSKLPEFSLIFSPRPAHPELIPAT